MKPSDAVPLEDRRTVVETAFVHHAHHEAHVFDSINSAFEFFDKWLAFEKQDAVLGTIKVMAEFFREKGEKFGETALTLTGDDNTRYHAYSAMYKAVAHQMLSIARQVEENHSE